MSLYKAILRWRETFELSFQLSNIVFTLLDTTIDYCKENNIPIHEETGIWNLAKEARHIFKLIEETNSSEFKSLNLPELNHLSDDFLQGDASDEDFTEPVY